MAQIYADGMQVFLICEDLCNLWLLKVKARRHEGNAKKN
jgi:hypothetical protein